MNKPALSLLLFILLSSFSPAQAGDEVMPAQLQQIESLQRRAESIAFGEPGADNYHLATAMDWAGRLQAG